MARYTIISDVGQAIISILKEKLIPEPIDKPEKIGICEPKDRGEYVVGIHLYDIREHIGGQEKDPISLPDGNVQDPPALLELFYMISVASNVQIEFRSTDESRIIGKIIQTFKDNQIIPKKYISDNSKIEDISINMLPLEIEEKIKIWSMFGESYKLSAFFIVGPIAIDSEIIRRPQKRVETVILGSMQYIPRKIVQFETRIKDEDIDDEYTQKEEEDESFDDEGDSNLKDEDTTDDFDDESDLTDDLTDDLSSGDGEETDDKADETSEEEESDLTTEDKDLTENEDAFSEDKSDEASEEEENDSTTEDKELKENEDTVFEDKGDETSEEEENDSTIDEKDPT